MKLSFEGFAGEIPRTEPRYLQPSNAADASGVAFLSGNLNPMRKAAAVTTLGSVASKVYLNGTSWFALIASADVATGPVDQDRLYFTYGASGPPRMFYGSTYYGLALAKPTAKPTMVLEIGAQEASVPNTATRIFTRTGSRWVASNGTYALRVLKKRGNAAVGEKLLIDTAEAEQCLIALLPTNPAAGEALAVRNEGPGLLIVHRNGKTINGGTSDLGLPTKGQQRVLIYSGGTWITRLLPRIKREVAGSVTSVEVIEPGDNSVIYSPNTFNLSVGEAISTRGEKLVKLRLPNAPHTVGDIVSIQRSTSARVQVSAAETINGDTSDMAEGDRRAYVWTGSEWKVLKIDGEHDADYPTSKGSRAVASGDSVNFLTGDAPKALVVSLPTATAGQSISIGAIGSWRALILPQGKTINGEADVLTLVSDGQFDSFTYGSNDWATDRTEIRAVGANTVAKAGETILAYADKNPVTVSLPGEADAGATVTVRHIGPRPVKTERLVNLDEPETVVYAYTWVTSLGEESQPSPLSSELTWYPGLGVTVTTPTVPPAGRLVTLKRVYRSVTTATGATDLFFVKELAVGTATYLHDVDVDTPQEPIPSKDFDPPIATLSGLIELPNGMMAAFSGKDLYFCEPFQPHAWPDKYTLAVQDTIVGLAAFGSSLAILTTGTPYVVQGIHPEAMAMSRMEQSFPCLAKAGIVDMGYAAFYPSTNGLVQITQTGAQLVSDPLWTREQWLALNPASFRAAQFQGRYAFTYQPGGTGARKLAYVDTTGAMPFLVPADETEYLNLYHHLQTGRLIGLKANGLTVESIDDAGADFMDMRWRSKPNRIAGATSFGALIVDGTPPDTGQAASFAIKTYRDGVLIHTITTMNSIERLPDGLGEVWEFELTGNCKVTRIAVAGTPDELWQ